MYSGSDGGEASARSLRALHHPLRVRIVEACTAWGALSPVEIVHRELCADVANLKGKTPRQQLSTVAYHCRQLADAGLLTLIDTRQVRGATQHFYVANAEAVFSEDEWAEMTKKEREEISVVMWQRFQAQVEIAKNEGTFDSRKDRVLAWGPLTLDEAGWRELALHMVAAFEEIERIRRDAESRLTEPGAVGMRATYGLFSFESPLPHNGQP